MVAPQVTVLLAVYNPPLGWLEQAVASILAQTFRDFELLLIDDGSETPPAWHGHDPRIRWVREPHRGLTASLNRGLALARAPLIARHDGDDWSAPHRLALQVAAFATQPDLALCGSTAWIHQQDGRPLWRIRLPHTHAEILQALPRGNPFVHGSTMFRRDLIQQLDGYRETFRCAQDYDLFWRIAEHYPTINLAEPLYHYRYAAGSVSTTKAAEQLAAHRAIQTLASARRQGIPEHPAAALAEATAEISHGAGIYRARLKQADHLMLAGQYRRAFRAYLDLIAESPASLRAWGKLARLGVFRAAPFLREATFG